MARDYLARRAASFVYAFRGAAVLMAERNSVLHLIATALAVGFGAWLGLPSAEWCALIVAIALVWMAEAFNTALEKLADAAVPQRHELVGRAKDVSATAVLIASAAALAIGIAVFAPRFWALW